MKMIALGEVITAAPVVRAGTAELPILSMTMHGGLVDQSQKFKKRVASNDLSEYKVVRRGQLVVGFPIDEGVLDFQSLYKNAIVSPAYGVWDLMAHETMDRNYFQRFLRSPRAMAYYKARLRGSTARRRSLPSDVFLSLEVPVPPLDEQRRIAAILDHADTLRTKRRRIGAYLHKLSQSIFVDQFSQVSGRATLGQLGVNFTSGKNVIGSELDAHPINRVIKVSAISSGHFNGNEIKPMPGDYEPPSSHRITRGDILFGRASGSLGLLGATAVVDEACDNLYLPDKVWRLEVPPGGPVIPEFVLGVLRSPDFRAFVRHNASGAAGVRNIGKARVLGYEAPTPQLEQQESFAALMARLRVQSAEVTSSGQGIDRLLLSLQARAFTGGL